MLNLDTMSIIKLDGLYSEINHHVRLSAKKYGYSVKDIKLIMHYAINKLVSMQLRESGKIQDAMKYESICENIYNRLSESARW